MTVSSELYAQLKLELSEPALFFEKPDMYSKQEFPSLSSILLDKKQTLSTVAFQKDYVFNCYGFFCKQEAKRDKKTSIPVRMRLGTLQEVNMKEYGKN